MYVIGGGVSSAWDAFAPTMFQELKVRSFIYSLTAPDSVEQGEKHTVVTIALMGSDAGLVRRGKIADAASRAANRGDAQLDGVIGIEGIGTLMPRSNAPNRSGILRHYRIAGEQGNAFDNCLRHQNAVERVFVNRRQSFSSDNVVARDGQFAVAIVEQAATEQPGVGSKIFSAQSALDRYLP